MWPRDVVRTEELAMKAVGKEKRIAVDGLSRQVQRNDQDGFFEPETYQRNLQKLDQRWTAALSTVEGAACRRKAREASYFIVPGCISFFY